MDKIEQIGAEKPRKQILWEKQIALLNEIESEPPIDENIKEAIAALNLGGIKTLASCGGHAISERHGGDTPYPWILFGDKIEEQSPKLETFLSEFYANRQVEDDIKLKVSDGDTQFTLASLDDDFYERIFDGKLTEEEKSDLVTKLPKRQREMEEFGQFLKTKFFEGD